MIFSVSMIFVIRKNALSSVSKHTKRAGIPAFPKRIPKHLKNLPCGFLGRCIQQGAEEPKPRSGQAKGRNSLKVGIIQGLERAEGWN